jgi:hypothetical protein
MGNEDVIPAINRIEPEREDPAILAANAAPEITPVKARDAAPQAKVAGKPSSSYSGEVNLRFDIDEETRQVTVMVIDRRSKRVIRTIPPDELGKLKEGDLFEMLI